MVHAGADDEHSSTAAPTQTINVDLQEFMVLPGRCRLVGAKRCAAARKFTTHLKGVLTQASGASVHRRWATRAGFAPNLGSNRRGRGGDSRGDSSASGYRRGRGTCFWGWTPRAQQFLPRRPPTTWKRRRTPASPSDAEGWWATICRSWVDQLSHHFHRGRAWTKDDWDGWSAC